MTGSVAEADAEAPATTAAPNGPSPTVPLGAELRSKEAVDVIKAMFSGVGMNADESRQVRESERISVCPLGPSGQLTGLASGLGVPIDGRSTFTLEMDRDPIPTIRCVFSNDESAGTVESTTADVAPITLDYQVTIIPGPQLRDYLTHLEGGGYERDSLMFGGAMYSRCTEPDPSSSVSLGACAAIWLNGALLVGAQLSGPGAEAVDLAPRLSTMIEPIVSAIADTDPTSIELA